jgi:signal peptidase
MTLTKFISGTLYALFVVLLLSIAGLFLASLLPIPGNIEIKIVKSGSMEPTILTGSIVVVKPAASYDVGDVVTFGEDTSSQIPTTHRIIAATGDFKNTFYTTKGDANEEQDPQQIPARDIIGKVVFSAPYAGYILDFARQPMGFTLMIGIPAGIIIMDELAKIWNEVARMRGRSRREEEEDAAMDKILAQHRMASDDEEEEQEEGDTGELRVTERAYVASTNELGDVPVVEKKPAPAKTSPEVGGGVPYVSLGDRFALPHTRIRGDFDGIRPRASHGKTL